MALRASNGSVAQDPTAGSTNKPAARRAVQSTAPMTATTSPPATVSFSSPGTASELNRGIAKLYDSSSALWEDVWGEHMHHGFYDPEKPPGDHRTAQVRMIEEALAWAGVQEGSKPRTILDVGCGIGGSSRYLAKKYSAAVKGITLSCVQAERATAITGPSDKVAFQVADALDQPFEDDRFDLIWSMESGEHMPDKLKFMQEMVRVAGPGGRLLIVTWCHRDFLPGETSLTKDEQKLLDKICDAYYLPAWCPASHYVNIAQSLGLEDVRSEDWTRFVTPFWPAVIASALSFKAMFGLLKSGWTTIRGAVAMLYMVQGYRSGLIKFVIVTGKKPSQ